MSFISYLPFKIVPWTSRRELTCSRSGNGTSMDVRAWRERRGLGAARVSRRVALQAGSGRFPLHYKVDHSLFRIFLNINNFPVFHKLIASKHSDCFTDFPFDDSVPAFPLRAHLQEYLSSYARHFNITTTIAFQHKVCSFFIDRNRLCPTPP